MNHHASPPEKIIVDSEKKKVEFSYPNGTQCLSFEFLRTHAPSADIKNPSTGKFNFIPNKKNIEIINAEPVGHYAIRFFFSDGYHSGIFSWEYLHWLVKNHDELQSSYQKLAERYQQSS